MVTAHSQALIMLAGQALLRAGAETGAINPGEYRSRLSSALDDAQSSWAGMASTWRSLTPPSARRLDPDLNAAANEARAALLEIVHDRTTLASPGVMAARVDLAATARTIQNALSAAVDQAHLIKEVIREPHLNGSARAVNMLAMDLVKDQPAGSPGTSEQAWVSPRDLLSNRLVPLPEPIRVALSAAAQQITQTTNRAMSAAACLDHPVVRGAGSAQPNPTVEASRETRSPPRLHATRPQRSGPRP